MHSCGETSQAPERSTWSECSHCLNSFMWDFLSISFLYFFILSVCALSATYHLLETTKELWLFISLVKGLMHLLFVSKFSTFLCFSQGDNRPLQEGLHCESVSMDLPSFSSAFKTHFIIINWSENRQSFSYLCIIQTFEISKWMFCWQCTLCDMTFSLSESKGKILPQQTSRTFFFQQYQILQPSFWNY